MTPSADVILLLIIALDLYIVATSRLLSCVRSTALQGALLALLPWVVGGELPYLHWGHTLAISVGTFLIKGLSIPILISWAIRSVGVRREVEPYVSFRISLLTGAALVGLGFVGGYHVHLPIPVPTPLFLPTAWSTAAIGAFVLLTRKKAVTQVIGYLLLENGIFIFGQTLTPNVSLIVEAGILLDLLVAVFVMGIAIQRINRQFDHIDVDQLRTLRG